MKVYVVTTYRALCQEQYYCVKASRKLAEACIREKFPHMRKVGENTDNTTCYSADATSSILFSVHEEEV